VTVITFILLAHLAFWKGKNSFSAECRQTN